MFLGVNTSEEQGQICLYSEKLYKDITWKKKGSHSERLTENFHKLLQDCKVALNEIQKIYCVTGPGSFTGIRVGINFSKTLSYCLKVPIIPVSSLNLLSLNCMKLDLPIVSAIDAQKNSFYISEFQKSSTELKIIRNHELFKFNSLSILFDKPKYICGNGFENYIPILDEKIKNNMIFGYDKASGDLFKFFANEKLFNSKAIPWEQVQPTYLKLSAPEEKLKPTFSN